MSETTIGSIVGFLRLDADQFHREIVKAITEVEVLDGKRASVTLDVDSSGVDASMDRVASSSRNVTRRLDDLTSSSRRLTDASDRVRLAEVKLAEVHERRNSKLSQIIAAEKALALAMRAQQDAIFDTYSANLDLADSNDEVEKSATKVERQSRQASRGVGALVTAVVALGPALVPLAAGVAGLALGFGGLGIAGAAAVFGIMSDVKAATAVGLTYRSETERLKTTLEGVGRVASANLLGSYQAIVQDLVDRTPVLTREIDALSNMAGRAGANLTGGLLSAFVALSPLIRDAATYVVGLTSRFEAAMSGPGIVAFGDYVRSVFPQVMQTVEELVTAGAHLVEAYAPLGLGTLSLLRLFADVINAIPVDVLAAIAPLATGVFVAFSLWQRISPIVDAAGRGLERVGASAQTAAVGMRALNIATGVIGAALAVLTFVFMNNAEQQRQAEQAANDYADALGRSNGVIDESIRKMTAKKLADEGVLDAARQLGFNLNDVTEAALGNTEAMARVNAHAAAVRQSYVDAGQAGGDFSATQGDVAGQMDKVTGAIGATNGELDAGRQKQLDLAAASSDTASSFSSEATAAENLADRYSTSAATYSAVIASQQQLADKAEAATLKMQLENDAAGLLKQSLDLLNGENMNVAQAQNSFERGQLTLASPIKQAQQQLADAQKRAGEVAADTGKKSAGGAAAVAKAQLSLTQAQDHLTRVQSTGKATAEQLASAQDRVERATLNLSTAQGKASSTTGGATKAQRDAADAAVAQAKANLAAAKSLTGSGDAAVTNRANLLNLASGAALVAEKFGDQKDSAEAGRKKLIELRDQIVKNAVAQGMNKDEVVKYIDSVLKIPASVPPTKADADTSAAKRKLSDLRTEIRETMKDRRATMFIDVATNVGSAVANITGTIGAIGATVRAKGGPIPGFAGGGKLRGPGTGTSDSIVAVVRQTGKPVMVSTGEYVSTESSTKRNEAALAAGNRGATLAVAGQGGGWDEDAVRMLAREMARQIRQLPAPITDVRDIQTAAMER